MYLVPLILPGCKRKGWEWRGFLRTADEVSRQGAQGYKGARQKNAQDVPTEPCLALVTSRGRNAQLSPETSDEF